MDFYINNILVFSHFLTTQKQTTYSRQTIAHSPQALLLSRIHKFLDSLGRGGERVRRADFQPDPELLGHGNRVGGGSLLGGELSTLEELPGVLWQSLLLLLLGGGF